MDIAVTNSGTEKEGGQQVGIGPAAAAKCGPAADLLVFLVGAALLAPVGLVAEAGVVETSNGKTSLVHYGTLSFFAFRFLKKRKFAFFS